MDETIGTHGLPVIDSAAPILERLESLGGATNIANHLSNEGITGRPESSMSCPIAVYLKRETGKEWVVGPDSVRASLTYGFDGLIVRPDIPLGLHVQQFIRLFDAGVYPDLAEPFTPIGLSWIEQIV